MPWLIQKVMQKQNAAASIFRVADVKSAKLVCSDCVFLDIFLVPDLVQFRYD